MHESRTRQPAAKTPLLSTHRSFRLQIRSPHGNANGYASMETCLLFALYLLRASDHPGNFGTRPRSSHERAAELDTFVAFLFSCCQAVHQVKKNIYIYIYSTVTLKNSTTALTPPASNHYSIFADLPLINHTNYCPLFPPALGSAPFPFLFPFLPQNRTLRQVARNTF